MKYYHIDSFTQEVFKGNSAGVIICDKADVDDRMKQALATELNHSETAFVFMNQEEIILRWFTPSKEIDLCGHGTLASAFALWDSGLADPNKPLRFSTKSGILTAVKKGEQIELDFPQFDVDEYSPNALLNTSLGIKPLFTGKNDKMYLIEVDSPETLLSIQPDFKLLEKVDQGIFIVTCKSNRLGVDFLSRVFAPYFGIKEDPVTGSAHSYLAPYWAKKLQKKILVGFQESARTGIIECEVLSNDRVKLRGLAKKLFSTELDI